MSWLFSQCSRYRLITLHAAVVPSDLSHLSATLSSSMDSADVHLNFSYDGIISKVGTGLDVVVNACELFKNLWV